MLIPFASLIVMVADTAESTSKGGLFLPDTAREKPQTATIESLGDAVSIDLKKGGKVVYKEYSTTLIKEDGKEYLLIEQADILAKVASKPVLSPAK